MHSFFITGTDTNIGKTAITCSLIAKCIEEGFRAGGMKPVAAGCHIENGYMISDDVKKIIEVSNVDLNIKEINPYSFELPIAPHISFKSNEIDIHLIKKYLRSFENKMDYLFIEGVGGYAVPLTETFTTADLVENLDIPVILVVGMKLGCINHALLTVESILNKKQKLCGWVANRIDGDMQAYEENFSFLKEKIKAPCLGEVPYFKDFDPYKASKFIDINKLNDKAY
ncbi:MAG: dethiobiotin synthase [Candidatus Methylopumilus sp.]|jgi:dethiobiotin synthetase|nr:dethiobiotin synthase [Methylophilaceae bacterium]